MAFAALDALPRAVVVLRACDLHLVHANTRARRLAATTDPLFVAGDDGVAATAAGRALQAAVHAQLAAGADEAVHEVVAARSRLRVTVTRLAEDAPGPERAERWVAVLDEIPDDPRLAIDSALARLVESGLFGVFYATLPPAPGAGVTAANDAFVRLLGWTHEEIAAGALRAPAAFTSPATRSRDVELMTQLRRDGILPPHRLDLVRKDGSILPALGVASLRSENTFIALFLDRSELVAQESALRAAQARWEAVQGSGLVGTFLAKSNGDITDVDDTCARMVGYDRAGFLARWRNLVELTPPEWLPVTRLAHRQLDAHGRANPYRKELQHADGHRVLALVVPIRLDEHHDLGLVFDLSEEQRAERALRATEDQLHQIQKVDAIGRLAGSIAHDFNNILSVILGYVELVQSDLSESDPIRDTLVEIERAASRASSLTSQLLLASRQDGAEPLPVVVDAAIGQAMKMLMRLVGEDVELVFEPGAPDVHVLSGPAHLEQVVMNLVINARDAMPSGGRVTVRTAHEAGASRGDAGPVTITVADTGIGMDDTTRARIFEPFFTTKPRGKGTGLGLSTVFRIVDRCEGHVVVDSAPGAGTTFIITLPVVPPPGRASVASPRGAPRPSGMPRETVLLVEDEAPVRRVARLILESAGFRVIEASGAAQAVELYAKEPAAVHLLLTDLVMPGEGGLDLTRRLREACPALRVLCMSGYTEDMTARHTITELGARFLQKPFTPDSLRQAVRAALDAPCLVPRAPATAPAQAGTT